MYSRFMELALWLWAKSGEQRAKRKGEKTRKPESQKSGSPVVWLSGCPRSMLYALCSLCFSFLMAVSISGEPVSAASLSLEGGHVGSTAPIEDDISLEELTSCSAPKRELLLLQEVPVVITPAKIAQPILESPSTITVLTREDIRRYGMTSFSDILRNVPGVDVISVSSTDRNVSIRGFNGLSAGRVLSLVDNRPIYLEFYGETLWEFLPVSVEEIERIEIIRGPDSALYGAHAFDGVVNIITDSVLTAAGTRVTAAVNQSGKFSGSAVHGGGVGGFTYKASVGWDRVSGWDDGGMDAGENRTLNSRLRYAINERSHICLSGGVQSHQVELKEFPRFDSIRDDGKTDYLKMDYVRSRVAESSFGNPRVRWDQSKGENGDVHPCCKEFGSDLKCHILWHRGSGVAGLDAETAYWFESNTFDAEIQHSFRFLSKNFITWGLNYRFNRTDSEIFDALYSQNLWAGYMQDQIRLSRSLTLTAGLRCDKHPLTGNNLSPRGSIVYSPLTGQVLRASIGRAFQNPWLIYSHVSTSYETSRILPTPISVGIYGNKELSPEWMTSFEFGYRGIFGARFRGSVGLFFNKVSGLIDFGVAETYVENALFPRSPGGVIPSMLSAFNSYDVDARGSEVTADLSMTRWLSVNGNYSYQYITDSKTGERIESAPQHKLNSGLCVKLDRRLLVSLFSNYVDRTVWDGVDIDPYGMINSVVSYRALGGSVEITLSVSNLLNDRHLEHPNGDEIGRSMVLNLIYRIH